MANQISPQEFHLLVDNPTIRTKCPRDQITDAMIIKRVKNGNLIAGDSVRVQCMNSDYTDLLAECEYRVISRKTELVTHEISDSDIRQVEKITFRVERWTDWREVGQPDVAQPPVSVGTTQLRSLWNIGSRGYDIMRGEVKVGFHENKETANRIAAGELPLPEAV